MRPHALHHRGHQRLEYGRFERRELRDERADEVRALLAHFLHGVREPAQQRGEHGGGEGAQERVRRRLGGLVACQQPACGGTGRGGEGKGGRIVK
jgi:hypothetical protein